MKKIFRLEGGWKFSLDENSKNNGSGIKPGEWTDASVPGTVHTDLLNNGLIEDPFYADNETGLQWIGEAGWNYRTHFNYPADFDEGSPVIIVFEGLDTAAEVIINGSTIGRAENMFRRYEFDITGRLVSENNELVVRFTSAVKYARAMEERHGKLPVALRSERVYIRKAQYSFGWDWGPCFITCGIWKSVYLVQKSGPVIENILFETRSISDKKADVVVKALTDRKLPAGWKIKASLKGEGVTSENESSGAEEIKKGLHISVPSPRLWNPAGLGMPYLYELTVCLTGTDGKCEDEMTKRVGIRTLCLDQGNAGRQAFRLAVNGTPVFAMGANWIPADSFLPRVTEHKYRALLTRARDANMNMIRVWGGGIYENDIFYELCDELGLMVWQDFMFACASYPETDEFKDNVIKEAEENISRLQHHASLALWCGNNENEWIWHQEQKRPVSEMPGFSLFQKVIPQAVKKLDPGRTCLQSTPYGKDEDPNSQTSGNRHQWDLWSRWVDYKKVREDRSLFVTEFGFQGPAGLDAFKGVLGRKDRSVQSKAFEFHNKQTEGPERLFKFLISHLPLSTGFSDFIYLAQLSQALALKECVEHWRMRWPDTAGTVIWQLNDCWPVTSWSLIDSEEMPKLSCYAVKRAFAPQLTAFRESGGRIEAVIVNSSMEKIKGKLTISYIDIASGKSEEVWTGKANLEPQANITAFDLQPSEQLREGRVMLSALLEDTEGNRLSENYFVMDEWKYIRAAKADINLRAEEGFVMLTSGRPALFVYLQCSGAVFEDNGFMILPGEKVKVRYTSAKGTIKPRDIKIKCLNDYMNK